MPERIKEFMPFMIGAIASVPGAKVNMSRVLEAIIIAAITGMVSTYGVTKVIETKMDMVIKRMDNVELQERTGREETRNDIREVRIFINQHILGERR